MDSYCQHLIEIRKGIPSILQWFTLTLMSFQRIHWNVYCHWSHDSYCLSLRHCCLRTFLWKKSIQINIQKPMLSQNYVKFVVSHATNMPNPLTSVSIGNVYLKITKLISIFNWMRRNENGTHSISSGCFVYCAVFVRGIAIEHASDTPGKAYLVNSFSHSFDSLLRLDSPMGGSRRICAWFPFDPKWTWNETQLAPSRISTLWTYANSTEATEVFSIFHFS